MAANTKKLAVLLGLVAVGSCVPTWELLGLGGGKPMYGCSSCQPSAPDIGPKVPAGGPPGYGPTGDTPPRIDKPGPGCEGVACGGKNPYGPEKKCSSCHPPDEAPPKMESPTYGPPGPRPVDTPYEDCDGAKEGVPCGKDGPYGPKNKMPEPESPNPRPPVKTKVVQRVESKSITFDSPKTAVLPDVPLRTPIPVSTGAGPTANPNDTNLYTGVRTTVSVELNTTRVPEKQVEDIMIELGKRPCEIRGDRFSMPEVPELARTFSFMLVVTVSMDVELKREYRYAPCEPHQHGRVVSFFQGQYIMGFPHKVEKRDKGGFRLLVEGNEMTDVVIEGTDIRREPIKEKDVEGRVVVNCGSGVGSCGEPKKCQGDECRSNLEMTLEIRGTVTITTGSVFKPCRDEGQCQCVRACADERCVSQEPMPEVVTAQRPIAVTNVMPNPPLDRMLDTIAGNTSPPQYGAPQSGPAGAPQPVPVQPGSPRSGTPSTNPGTVSAAPPTPSGGRIAGTGNSTRTNSTDLPRPGAAGPSRSANIMSTLAVVAASALALLL